MPPPAEEDIVMEDENYASSEDSDFAPENAPDNASAADSDDEVDEAERGEAATAQQQPSKATKADAEAEDAGFENSGDEAIIGKGKKKRRRDEDDGEDGGAGGFVKTRNQRANEKAERRAAAVQGPVTVDVDALFMQMMGGGGGSGGGSNDKQEQRQADLSSLATAAMVAATAGDDTNKDGEDTEATAKTSSSHVEMIKIKRTYNFAGEVHTEEKIVARDSAEAKLYLEQVGADNIEIVVLNKDGEEETKEGDGDDDQPKRLPPRKAFRSAFEPILDPSLVQIGARTDLDLGLAARLQARERSALQRQQQAAQDQAKKLTTVEKSRMDWAGFVDREGIQDELALAGKSKGAFVDRQSFLARTEMRREEEARRARMSGKV